VLLNKKRPLPQLLAQAAALLNGKERGNTRQKEKHRDGAMACSNFCQLRCHEDEEKKSHARQQKLCRGALRGN
jgi:hypothetical protein